MSVTKKEVLKLYKNLLSYSKSLTFTDRGYYRTRIIKEFEKNKTLTNAEDILYAFKVRYLDKCSCYLNLEFYWLLGSPQYRKERHYYKEDQSFSMFLRVFNFNKQAVPLLVCSVQKHTIDYSKIPKVPEHEFSEQFVRGSGPGGSAVNKNANCVVLTHIPSGVVVKCHLSRCQDENRRLAREMLISKLDDIMNGEESVKAQKKRLQENKLKKLEYKKKKKAKLKEEWKKREDLM